MTNNFLQSFSQIIMRLKVNKIHSLSVLIFIIVFLFSWWSNPSLAPGYSPDTWEFLDLARDSSDPAGELRPIFYPFFVRLCMQLGGVHWAEVVVLFQMILHTITIVFINKLFLKFNTPNVLAIIFSLAIGFNPNLLFYSSRLLPQQILGVLIFFTIYYSIELIRTWEVNSYNLRNKYLYLTGIFSGIALITKPSWILGILPVVFTFFYTKKISNKTIMVAIILISLHFSFNLVWSEYKEGIGNRKVYGIDSSNMIENFLFSLKGNNYNHGIIRLGLVDYGEGTALYERLKEKKLLDLARSMNGKVTSDYQFIRKSFTWEEWNDVEFAKSIFKKAPFQYIFGQLGTWHTFFTKRMFYRNDGYPGLPNIVKYIYIGSYYNLYRPCLSVLLILFLFLLKVKTFRPLVVLVSLTLVYFSLVHAIFTPSPQHFIYYRTSVEYILFFAAFLPIGYFYNLMKPRFIYYYKKHIE